MLCKHHHGEILTNFSLNSVAFPLKDERGNAVEPFPVLSWDVDDSSQIIRASFLLLLSAIFGGHYKLPAIFGSLTDSMVFHKKLIADRYKVMAKQVTIIHQLHEILHISLKNK